MHVCISKPGLFKKCFLPPFDLPPSLRGIKTQDLTGGGERRRGDPNVPSTFPSLRQPLKVLAHTTPPSTKGGERGWKWDQQLTLLLGGGEECIPPSLPPLFTDTFPGRAGQARPAAPAPGRPLLLVRSRSPSPSPASVTRD